MEELSERCGLSLGVGFQVVQPARILIHCLIQPAPKQLSAKDVLTEDFSQITLNIY